jgi:hypothetical protein
MSVSEPIPFTCRGCGTKYKIVLIDPAPFAAINCVQCDVALTPTKGMLSSIFSAIPRTIIELIFPRHERGIIYARTK